MSWEKRVDWLNFLLGNKSSLQSDIFLDQVLVVFRKSWSTILYDL